MIEEILYMPLEDLDKDKLGFKERAQEIANFINDFSPKLPYSFSINGPWGSGKSTMLNFIEASLDKGKCKVVRFNPWMISENEELIKSLFEEIYYAMGEGDFQKAKETFFKYARKLIPSAAKALTFTKAYMNGLPPAAATATSTIAGETVQVFSDALFDEKPLSKRKQELNEMLKDTLLEDGQKIVIMIDELDRLFPKEVVTVFQMIKSNLDLPGLFFVVAMDEEVVYDALTKEGIGKPEYYLQKIFQRKYIINTKHQLMTLTDSFLVNNLNSGKNGYEALHKALLAFFYQKKEYFIFSLPELPITFYDSSLKGEYESITPINEVEVLASYREISMILREEINLHNPRTFLRFSEILLERWGAFYDYVFQGEEKTSYFVYVAFLIFVSHYAFPDFIDENYVNINRKIKDSTPPIIKRLRNYIYYLTPTYRKVSENGNQEIVYYDSIIKKSVFYLNKFPDDLKYHNAISMN